jgi:hypothetical protein
MNYEIVFVKIGTPLHITDVAQALNSDFKTIKELNPHILDHHLPKGNVTLNVPSGLEPKAVHILGQLSRIADLRTNGESCCYALVKPGDTLYQIAKRTGLSVPELQKLNSMSGSLIKVGQKLRLVP